MVSDTFELVIGDKNYSSWSLRPWLLLSEAQIPFREINIRLRQPNSKEEILKHSPSGQVPALKWRGTVIPDSLAICETVAELFPDKKLWPDDALARARARSAAAEMHSGFGDLRRDMPMDLINRFPGEGHSQEALAAASRVVALWRELRRGFGAAHSEDQGFLFGRFGVVDAMYAPVATRFQTFGVKLAELGDSGGQAQAYMQTLLGLASLQRWTEGAKAEMQAHGLV
jgi:glutathione S-transferase